jgi:hypothetical protein
MPVVTVTVGPELSLLDPHAASDPPSSASSIRGVAAYFGEMTFTPPLAHLGHWYMWVLYMVPVLIVLAASFHALIDQRREDREREAAEAADKS